MFSVDNYIYYFFIYKAKAVLYNKQYNVYEDITPLHHMN